MDTDQKGWIASRFARLSTGLKMLLILALALTPLGLIAILASVESAREKRADRAEETLSRLEIKAQRLEAALSRSVLTIGTASAAISLTPAEREVCQRTLERLERGPGRARYALFAAGTGLRCASPGFTPADPPLRARGAGTLAQLTPGGDALQLFVFGDGGALEGVAEYSKDDLARITYLRGLGESFDLELRQGDRAMVLRDQYEGGTFQQSVRGSEMIADGQLELRIALSAMPLSATDFLLILVPVLMWLSAALVGWLVADRLLLRPLVRMQRVVTAYRPGDRELALPRLSTPAREIGELGEAFDQVVQTVTRHEADLEAAVERQTKLVREVHHRVKNNLQVVASLLNLHARGSPNEEVAAAYASIQRRVDALAVVHRNHYAELEENRGVGLKPLISELGANLRATAPASAADMLIRLDLEAFYVTQDVAVSVAFLITEIVEFAMFCGASHVSISLRQGSGPNLAALVVASESLRGDIPCDDMLSDRFERIVTGLSRQLRSNVERDRERGRYAIEVAVLDRADHG